MYAPQKINLWKALVDRMTRWRPDWTIEVQKTAVTHKLEQRLRGEPFSDEEVFEAILLALLSNNTRWDKIQRIRSELVDTFDGFSLSAFADKSKEEIEDKIVPWFLQRKAGSTVLRLGLLRLRDATQLLMEYSRSHGRGEMFFLDAQKEIGSEPEDLALAIGLNKRWKLPGFGVALAAEALRNLGFDLCKPDRHILRAAGQWALVEYKNWPDRSRYLSPQSSVTELRDTMIAIRSLAEANGNSVSYTDTTIWTACAASPGAHLSNEELKEILDG